MESNLSRLDNNRWDLIVMIQSLVLVLFFIIVRVIFVFLKAYVWEPLRIRRFMERQGVKGPPPSFMVGNLMAIANLCEKATVNDMESLSHDIVNRILPHYVKYSRIYGTLVSWPTALNWVNFRVQYCTRCNNLRRFLLNSFASFELMIECSLTLLSTLAKFE